MARAEDGRLEHEALKYLKRHKKLPSLSAMRGYLARWFEEKFMKKEELHVDDLHLSLIVKVLIDHRLLYSKLRRKINWS